MGCCGQKRALLRARPVAAPTSEPAAAAEQEPPDPSLVPVEYRGAVPVLLRGPSSGRLYTFTPARRVHRVAAGDAAALRRDPRFGGPDATRDEGSPDGRP